MYWFNYTICYHQVGGLSRWGPIKKQQLYNFLRTAIQKNADGAVIILKVLVRMYICTAVPASRNY